VDKFRILEHVADGYVEVYGETLEEAFENVGRSLFAVMTEVDKIEPRERVEIRVEGEDLEALLFEWLSELIARFDLTHMLMSKFKIKEIRRDESGFTLNAEAWGEELNPNKHISKIEVKAATYNRMEIIKKPERVLIRYVVDL